MAISGMDFGSGAGGNQTSRPRRSQTRSSDTHGLRNPEPPREPVDDGRWRREQQEDDDTHEQPQQVVVVNQPINDSRLVCPHCGSQNIHVQVVEQGQRTARKGAGPLGNMNNLLRFLVGIMTCGIAFFFWKKSEGTMRTRTITSTLAVCQSCGNTWTISKPAFDTPDDEHRPVWQIVLIVVGCLFLLSMCARACTSGSSSRRFGSTAEYGQADGVLEFSNVDAKITYHWSDYSHEASNIQLKITGDMLNSSRETVRSELSFIADARNKPFELRTADGKSVTEPAIHLYDGVGHLIDEVKPGDLCGFEYVVSLSSSDVREFVLADGYYECKGLDGLESAIHKAFTDFDNEISAKSSE